MINIDYSFETRRYRRPDRAKLKALILRAIDLVKLPVDFDWVLNIRFVGDRTMAAANWEFVGHEGSTDVITFSYFDDLSSLFPGDPAIELIICLDAARREGEARRDSSYSREAVLYIVHGLLHSAGEDDLAEKTRKRMRAEERRVMTVLAEEFNFDEVFG